MNSSDLDYLTQLSKMASLLDQKEELEFRLESVYSLIQEVDNHVVMSIPSHFPLSLLRKTLLDYYKVLSQLKDKSVTTNS